MAKFKAHISLGVLLGLFSSIFVSFFSLTKNILIALIVFFSVIIGSFLPDIDSDTGTPFQIIFGLLSFLAAIIMFYYLLQKGVSDHKMLIGLPIASLIFFRVVIGKIFQKITHHRGIWHSIPFVLIVTLFALLITNKFDISPYDKLIISISIGVGYLSHLILDEIYSLINISGIPFTSKKSLGSALKFSSKSKTITFIAYLTVFALIYFTFPVLSEILRIIQRN
jgi:hypothetical protein